MGIYTPTDLGWWVYPLLYGNIVSLDPIAHMGPFSKVVVEVTESQHPEVLYRIPTGVTSEKALNACEICSQPHYWEIDYNPYISRLDTSRK